MQAAVAPGSPPAETMVSRDRERGEIRSFLRDEDDPRRVLRIEGDAGIGKSTLWRAGLREAEALGFRVLACTAVGSEAQLSFTSVRDLLAAPFEDVAAKLAEPQRHALAVALLQEEPTATRPEPATIAVAVLSAFRALARDGPVLLAVDDVQWVDPASARPLAYAFRRLEGDPIRVLLAKRLGLEDPTTLGQDAGDPLTRVLDLGGLSVGALGSILHDRLGVAFSRPTLHRLHEVSDGNPYFALELARALQHTSINLAPGDPLPVPTSLRELLRAQLETLPQETLDALTHLAVLARPSLTLLEAALGGEAAQTLVPAVEANAIDVSTETIRFAHPLLAAGVLDLASPDHVRAVHRRLAPIVQNPEERARHLALGADGPDGEIAAALEAAARRVDARGHRNVSAELYEAAARLTPDDLAGDRARRALAAASALFDAGDANRAAATIEALLGETAGETRERVEAQLLLGKILAEVGRRQEATRLWARTLEATDDPAAVADIRSSLAVMAIYATSAGDAIEHADHAVAAARSCRDDLGRLAYAYAARALAGVAAGDSSYRAYLQDALELQPAIEPRSSAWDWSPKHAAAACALHAFDVEEIRLRFGVLLARGVDSGNADLEQYGAYGLAQAELAAGDPERAAELTGLVVELAEETGVLHLPAERLRAEVDAHYGRASAARTRLRAAISEGQAVGEQRYCWQARAALGALELADGNAPAAAEELHAARALAVLLRMRDPALATSLVDEIEAAAAANVLDQAEEALAFARRLPTTPSWAGPLLVRAAAVVAARRGELEEAASSLEAALSQGATLPLQHGRTLLALGSVQRRLRRRAAARETLEEAVATFERLEARLWLERTREELARVGGKRAASDELTAAERRIAELVAEGKTNKEVAAELVLADRTVESTLTQVYRKLNVRSRTELTRMLSARR